MARRKSIVLDLASIGRLSTEGRCVLSTKGREEYRFRIGSTYNIKGIEGVMVRVMRITTDSVYLEKIDVAPEVELRMVKLVECKPEGAFLDQKRKFQLGEELVVAEPYCNIWEELHKDSEFEAIEFMHRVAEAHREDVKLVRGVCGWYNADKVLPELMRKRIVVTEVAKLKAQEICDGDWEAIGVRCFSEYYKELKRKDYVGRENWNANKEVILYRYECK